MKNLLFSSLYASNISCTWRHDDEAEEEPNKTIQQQQQQQKSQYFSSYIQDFQ